MTGKLNFKLGALCAVLTALLVVPALAQDKKEGMAGHYKAEKEKIIKELKLAPDKEKAVLAVEDKYTGKRQEIIAGLKKAHEDLQAALAAPKPDEAKVKESVDALNSSQDALFNSFKSQRDEELALMSPIEQGKYLMALGQWRHEMMEHGKKGKKK